MLASPLPSTTTDQPAILLADDDEPWRDATESFLTAAGYAVYTSPDYSGALRYIEDGHRVDLLVTDIVMPGRINGIALARMVRMRRPHLPVVYVTGHDIPGFVADDGISLMRKPVVPDALLAHIGRV